MKKKITSRILLAALAAFTFSAFTLPVPPACAVEEQGVQISVSDAEYLNILTNQYLIDHSRAATLKSKIKKAAPDKAAEATRKYNEASDKSLKSLDKILARMDELIGVRKYQEISSYVSGLYENYPNKYSYFKPVFEKLEENIKFKITSTPEKETAATLTTLLTEIDSQKKLFSNKKPAAETEAATAAAQPSNPASGNINSSTSTDLSDEGQAAGTGSQASADAKPAVDVEKDGVKTEKEWTFMVYMNSDNDLESAGIKDLNEMENVGSTSKVNIVVQCDRSPEYDESNGNWVGARRFYMEKDSDFSTVNSKMAQNLGESVDMGDPAVLLDFLKWGVKNYPAKKYAVVIWNHGSGWKFANARFSPVKGISYDESSGNHLDNFKLTAALAEAVKFNGGKKFEILSMDACLMAMLEVAYQVKDTAKIYVASEEVAPGDGMPYDLILSKLAEKPSMDERELSQIMVENDIRSYKGGSQGWANCTFSAFDLSNIDKLAEKVDALSKALIENFDKLSYPILLSRLKVLKYSDADYADLYNFCQLIQNYSKDAAISKLCDDIMDMIGRPDSKGDFFESFNTPVVITSEKAGKVKWTINEKLLPPGEYVPEGSKISKDKSFIETPLVADGNNGFKAVIGPFNGSVQVNNLNYTIFYSDNSAGTEKNISSSNFFFTKPANTNGQMPVIIAEGHSQALSASHGISIYLTPFEDYLLGYKNLDFSRKYAWSAFISYKPVFKTTARVLLVPDTGYVSSDLVYSKFYNIALNQSKINYDLYLPAIYGELEEEVLNRYKDGAVIWFTSKNANCISKYEETNLSRFIEGGGKLFINGQNIEQHHGLSKFFTESLGALYVEDTTSKKIAATWEKFKVPAFDIGGEEGANNVADPSVFNLASDKAAKIFT
ncbi:MAG TPA: clostripain-related cysteine peptidase, partial [Candidatus Wallbacteria bacterium]|nr:clostripain-related cysteine peptidase [Candidatus Wallbacteria bacterium]